MPEKARQCWSLLFVFKKCRREPDEAVDWSRGRGHTSRKLRPAPNFPRIFHFPQGFQAPWLNTFTQ
jgi:hypothetical protein